MVKDNIMARLEGLEGRQPQRLGVRLIRTYQVPRLH
jgi:hypothetical protein